ncbi:MAG: hypothetical protein LPJ89_07545 [Hymenobacteraceae bacterium]|nr:hypothetical protein [Hymenobacteraceae bacterium]MDX5397692.1 hypothetical protein [Hymenobacteraceae bacterium]MDX5443620.1 hypothetical protein [Hymenobacteraceae bacterium]MDX5513770.1 hypothetical protein [Hymenobacteraceae bacterium]
MNSYQFLAATGLIMTAFANLLLFVSGKEIDSFWAVYLCWLVLFIIGSIINLNSDPNKTHHHHHH